MDILIPVVLTIVLLGSTLGFVVYGSLWLWSLPWHPDEEAGE